MPFQLSYPLTQDLATNHYGLPQGTTGRGGNSIVGLVLHELGQTLGDYATFMHTNVQYANRRPGHPSVHYAVANSGVLRQFIPDANTAWGIEELSNPTWSLAGNYPGIDPNYLFVQIGLESFVTAPTAMFQALAQLVAYVCLNNSIAIDATHVITHDQLSDLYPQCAGALLTNLISTAQALAAGYTPSLPNIVAVAAQATATANGLATLQGQVSGAISEMTALGSHPALVGNVQLGHVEASPTIRVASDGVMNTVQLAAAYAVDPGQPIDVAPTLPKIVNFSVQVFDQQTPWVTTGSFWNAKVPRVGDLLRLRARVQFVTASWTAGNTLALDLYKNNALLARLGVLTIQATQSGDYEVSGECPFVVAAADDAYDVRITHTNNATRTLSSGSISIERV